MERPYQFDFDCNDNLSSKRSYNEYINISEKRHCKNKHKDKYNKCNKRKFSLSKKNNDLDSPEKKMNL
jgi:hypothetical protein